METLTINRNYKILKIYKEASGLVCIEISSEIDKDTLKFWAEYEDVISMSKFLNSQLQKEMFLGGQVIA